ncbi:MAG: hypothetical protein JWO43_395 [Candidatus Adlerbacteria bacterium]|nr:hypothetical protein [Candidatus Adlerbacteria bacterium]
MGEYTTREYPARVHKWDEESGYHDVVTVIWHEVLLGDVVVARPSSARLAKQTARWLNRFTSEHAAEIVRGFADPAESKAIQEYRQRNPPRRHNPYARHSIAD